MYGITNNLFAFNNETTFTEFDILFWKLIPIDSYEYDSGQTINVWSLDGVNNTNVPDFLLAHAVTSRNLSLFSSLFAVFNMIF